MTSNIILAKINNLKTKFCQKLYDGIENVDNLRQVEKALVEKDEPDNYYQAEAIRQAIKWWDELTENKPQQ